MVGEKFNTCMYKRSRQLCTQLKQLRKESLKKFRLEWELKPTNAFHCLNAFQKLVNNSYRKYKRN